MLLRHGKTEANLEKRYIGSRTDIPLSDDGIKALEAMALGIREMAGKKIFLVSSPMKRAVQTAEILFPGTRIQTKENLREIDFGDFEGKNYKDLNGNADYQKWIDSNGTLPFPNGEDRAVFIQRSISEFMSVLFEAGEDERVLLCLDEDKIGSPIVYEDDGGYGRTYPHVYGPIKTDAVIQVLDYLKDEEGHYRKNGEFASIRDE